MKIKPNCEEIKKHIEDGGSLRQLSDLTNYSVTTLSRFCKDCGIETPPIGRPRGFKMKEKSKNKIGEANRRE